MGFMARPQVGAFLRNLQPVVGPPMPFRPDLWRTQARQFRILDDTIREPSVVYLGDSITAWACVDEFLNFEGGSVLNRAICGDTTAWLYERIIAGFPAEVPVCFLLIGYNDLKQQAQPDEVAERIAKICDTLVRDRMVNHVVIESLLPTTTGFSRAIELLDARLVELGEQHPELSYLDLYPAFLKDDRPDASLFADHVHLNEIGIQRRIRLELEHLTRIAPELSNRLTLHTEPVP